MTKVWVFVQSLNSMRLWCMHRSLGCSLSALEKEGKVEKIARGLYRISNYDPGSHPDLVIASLQTSKGVICLLSALSFYEATNEIPKYVDLAILQDTHANRIKYPPSQILPLCAQSMENRD